MDTSREGSVLGRERKKLECAMGGEEAMGEEGEGRSL